jgi:hypothetical protein
MYCRLWRRILWYTSTVTSDVHGLSIFRVEQWEKRKRAARIYGRVSHYIITIFSLSSYNSTLKMEAAHSSKTW